MNSLLAPALRVGGSGWRSALTYSVHARVFPFNFFIIIDTEIPDFTLCNNERKALLAMSAVFMTYRYQRICSRL